MKIRNGFISNSSSSSFVVTNKDNWNRVIEILKETKEDYYIFKDVLYTSPIYENDYLSELEKLSSDERAGEIGGSPYGDWDEFVEVEGVLGRESIYLEIKDMTDDDLIKFGQAPYYISSKLYLEVKRFFDNGYVEEDIPSFLSKLKEIVEGDCED